MNKELEKFTDQELDAELSERRAVNRRAEIVKRIKNLSINNFKSKDMVVMYCEPDKPLDYRFQFYLKHRGKIYDSYNDFFNQKWWPKYKKKIFANGFDKNAAYNYIPDLFNTESENDYSFNGSLNDAIILLLECGYLEKNIKPATY
jgi:hypothetical protein